MNKKYFLYFTIGLISIVTIVILMFLQDYNFNKTNTSDSELKTEIIRTKEVETTKTTEVKKIGEIATQTQIVTENKVPETKIIPKTKVVLQNPPTKTIPTPVAPAPKPVIQEVVTIRPIVAEVIRPDSCTPVSGGFSGSIETEINRVRESYGLKKLLICAELRNSAFEKYKDIVTQNKFTHDWLGAKSLRSVILAAGYDAKSWGEILEYGSDFTTARDHVDNWLSSPTHKAIILDPNYTHFGIYIGGWTVEDISVDMGIGHFGKI